MRTQGENQGACPVLAEVPESVGENRVGLEEMGPDGEVIIFFSFRQSFVFLCGLSHGWDR